MGKALLPPGAISIPALAALMGLRHTTLYGHIWRGHGPKLCHVQPVPWSYPAKGSKRNRYVTIAAAIEWLEARRDAPRWADVIRSLRVQWIVDHVKAGIPLPRPDEGTYTSAYKRSTSRQADKDFVADVPLATIATGADR
jgi:hypothetical protein